MTASLAYLPLGRRRPAFELQKNLACGNKCNLREVASVILHLSILYPRGWVSPSPQSVGSGEGAQPPTEFFLHFSRKNAGFMHFYGEKKLLVAGRKPGP